MALLPKMLTLILLLLLLQLLFLLCFCFFFLCGVVVVVTIIIIVAVVSPTSSSSLYWTIIKMLLHGKREEKTRSIQSKPTSRHRVQCRFRVTQALWLLFLASAAAAVISSEHATWNMNETIHTHTRSRTHMYMTINIKYVENLCHVYIWHSFCKLKISNS